MARSLFLFLFLLAHPISNACTVFESPFAGDTRYAHNVDWYAPFPNVKGALFMNPANLEKRGELYGAPVKAAEWVSKYKSFTFSIAGAEFPVSGFNERGLSMMILELAETAYPDINDPRVAVSLGQFVQYHLDLSQSIDDVVAAINVVRPYSAKLRMHFMACESSGKCAVIQYINGQAKIYRDKDLPHPVLTNSLYPESAVAADACIKDFKACVSNNNSLHRFAVASQQRSLMTNQATFAQDAFTILEEVAQNKGTFTRYQMVFDPANQGVQLRKRGSKFGSLKVSFTNETCKTPRRYIPIDENTDGDLSSSWQPLTEAYQTDMALKMGHPADVASVYGHYPFTLKCLDK